MDTELLLEAYKVVSDLNDLLYDEFDEIVECFTVRAGICGIGVFFGDWSLWTEEEDSREFDEEKNEYGPLEGYIRKEFNDYITRLSRMKL